jgi:hypothetical protein
MSGAFPRSWSVGPRDDAADPDQALCRVWEVLERAEADWERVERQVNPLLYQLVEAGYVEEWGSSPTGSFWAITEQGHVRLAELGRD